MATQDITTIQISKETKERLEKLKIHPRQSFDEMLNLLLNEKEKKTE